MAPTPPKPKSRSSIAPYYSLILRSIRLQVLPQLTRWKNTREDKKTAIYHNRKISLLHALFHLIPTTAAFLLVALNLRTTYIGPMTNTRLTAIQFASKLLELLIQASIATTVLAFIRKQVLGSSPLPFGAFIAPYRTTDVSYLWSLDLWGSLTSPSSDRWWKVLAGLFLPGSVILATLVGPSSAVLMIPRPIDYPVSSRLTILNDSALEYPRQVDLVNGKVQLEAELNQTWYQSTVGGDGTGDSVFQVIDHSGVRTIQLSSTISGQMATLSGTVPTRMSAQMLSRWGPPPWDRTGVLGHAAQPYVKADCWIEDNSTVGHVRNGFVDFGPDKPYLSHFMPLGTLLANSTITHDNPSMAVFTWEGLVLGDDTSSLFSSVWHQPPAEVINHSILVVQGASTEATYGGWNILACTIDAIWETASVNYTDAALTTANQDISKFSTGAMDRRLIALSPQWMHRVFLLAFEQSKDIGRGIGAEAVNVALALSALPSLNGLPAIGEWWIPGTYNDSLFTEQQYTALSKFLTESRYPQRFDEILLLCQSSNWTNAASLATFATQSYLRGYGYDSTTVTVRLSLAVLLLYASGTVGYIAYTLVTGNSATSWDSMAEVVTLALKSHPPEHMENTSAGVDTLKTFRQPLNIRVNERGSLAIVVAEDRRRQPRLYTDVVPNEKY